MPNKPRPASVYLQFLALAYDARTKGSLPELDPLEERILTAVALANAHEERLCVRDLMARQELGAPATIHTRLKSMREKGWVMLTDTEDARRKQVEVAPAGRRYLGKLSTCVGKAMRG